MEGLRAVPPFIVPADRVHPVAAVGRPAAFGPDAFDPGNAGPNAFTTASGFCASCRSNDLNARAGTNRQRFQLPPGRGYSKAFARPVSLLPDRQGYMGTPDAVVLR